MARVLLVEDDDDTRQTYVEALNHAGYRATGMRSHYQALALLPQLQPSVIVMDRHLGEADGWRVTEALKRDPATASIPVIALTADSSQSSVMGALQAGCDAFLGKPCTLDALVATIERMLKQALGDSQRRARLAEAGEPDSRR